MACLIEIFVYICKYTYINTIRNANIFISYNAFYFTGYKLKV